jgi:hypothetical protein
MLGDVRLVLPRPFHHPPDVPLDFH